MFWGFAKAKWLIYDTKIKGLKIKKTNEKKDTK